MDTSLHNLNPDQLLEYCKPQFWWAGELSWKIGNHQAQQEVYESLRALPKSVRTAVCLISRRWGKSYLNVLMSLEDCIRKSNSQVFIIAPSLKHAQQIVVPLIRQITADAPVGLIKRTKSEYRWTLFNGSSLILGSFDTAVENIRGSSADAIYIEETGFTESLDDYEYILNSVLFPTLLHSGGRITHFTTPPRIPDHPFLSITIPQAELNNALFVKDIYTNNLLTPEQIEQEKNNLGGEDSIAWQREMLCQVKRDEGLVVVPEFNEEIHVKEIKLPQFYKTWVAGDLGGTRDKTAVYLLAYDFERDVVQIIQECAFDNQTPTSTIAKSLLDMEDKAMIKPLRRWIDGSGQTLTDLRQDFKYLCGLPDKQDFDAGINMLRAAFQKAQIEIDPSCSLLIATLRSGTFNKNRNDYHRTNALGHCDAIAALIYGYRMRLRDNPIPAHYGKSRESHHISKEDHEHKSALKSALKSAFLPF